MRVPLLFPVLLVLLLSLCCRAVAAEQPVVHGKHYGLSLHFARALHRAAIDSLPGIPEAREQFSSGEGNGVGIAGFLRLPLAGRLHLGVRGGMSWLGGTFTAWQTEPALPNGTPVPMTIRHSLEVSLLSLYALPTVDYSPIERLHVFAGPELGLLLSAQATQSEEITDPPGATWVTTNTPYQVLFDGTVPEVSRVQAGLVLGMAYNLPLNSAGTLVLAPEMLATVPLTRIRSEGNWSATVLRAGVSLFLAPQPVVPQPAPLPVLYDTVRTADTVVRIVAGLEREQIVPDTVIVQTTREERTDAILVHTVVQERFVRRIPELKPLLSAGVTTSFVLDDGRETRAAKVTMEEFIVHKYIPLLPYVFFAGRSAVLPDRYERLTPPEAAAFAVEHYNQESTLDIYYHLLNVLGTRMRDNPEALLTITGCTANEPEGQSLAEARARAVAGYLAQVWNIPASRLVVRSRSLPEHPSSMSYEEGVEENRRVELAASDPALFDPVVLTDTIRTVDPPTLRFRTRLFSEAGVRSWHIIISQQDRLLKELRGDGIPPSVVDWPIGREEIRPEASLPLEYRLAVIDSAGQSFMTPLGSIQFEQITISTKKRERRADRILDRFSLLLFDFDASALSQRHAATLHLIRTRLTPLSAVRITGTTDRVGEEDYNRLLSEKRAVETARALAVPKAAVLGAGEDTTTFPNDLPEGRLYSRTVRIAIETPIEVR